MDIFKEIENIIADFEFWLNAYDFINRDLYDEEVEYITNELLKHEDCLYMNFEEYCDTCFKICFYATDEDNVLNISIECFWCDCVIIDSDTITE